MYSQTGFIRTNKSFLLSWYASVYAKHWVRVEILEVTSHQLELFLRTLFWSGIPAWHTEEAGVLKQHQRQRKNIFAVRNKIDSWLSRYNTLRTMCNVLCISYYVNHLFPYLYIESGSDLVHLLRKKKTNSGSQSKYMMYIFWNIWWFSIHFHI